MRCWSFETGASAGGKGLNAVEAVNGEIFDALSGSEAEDQRNVDSVLLELDGTESKARLGANAMPARRSLLRMLRPPRRNSLRVYWRNLGDCCPFP